jgi:hypothetical protein
MMSEIKPLPIRSAHIEAKECIPATPAPPPEREQTGRGLREVLPVHLVGTRKPGREE